ncbi:hypothetical protein CEX73_02645 [Candidatus Palibaumannia cicadellinicola]|uniref:Uncharacterized protein n=1 Tax=Candidatus Palibaumannia cicadellinicola TaxID=186490 RepID=A0A2N4XWI2_9GAMM|nr:hypothetical protein CEX73_02645 [Candidatus Baumannia cicadellinicola]
MVPNARLIRSWLIASILFFNLSIYKYNMFILIILNLSIYKYNMFILIILNLHIKNNQDKHIVLIY